MKIVAKRTALSCIRMIYVQIECKVSKCLSLALFQNIFCQQRDKQIQRHCFTCHKTWHILHVGLHELVDCHYTELNIITHLHVVHEALCCFFHPRSIDERGREEGMERGRE